MVKRMRSVTVLLAIVVCGCSTKPATDEIRPADGTTAGAQTGEPARRGNTDEPAGGPSSPADSNSGQAAPTKPGSSPAADGEPGQASQPGQESRPEMSDDPSAAVPESALMEEITLLVTQMSSDAAIERRAAAEDLDAIGLDAYPCLLHVLQHGDDVQQRGAATYFIGRVSPRDDQVAAALVEALADENAALRKAALQAIEKLSQDQIQPAVPALTRFAENTAEGEQYRIRAIRAIAKLESKGRSAAPAIIQLAQKGDTLNLRRASYHAVAKIAPKEMAENMFIEQLQGSDVAELRRLAAKWLGQVVVSEKTLTALVSAFGDDDGDVQMEAVNTLVAIGKPSVAELVRGLESPNVLIRRHAVVALAKIGHLATDAIPSLKKLQDDPDEQVRKLTAQALRLLEVH
jgi:HEAT repeat protein